MPFGPKQAKERQTYESCYPFAKNHFAKQCTKILLRHITLKRIPTHVRKHTRYTRVCSNSLTWAKDTVDSGVIKELVVLRGNNTTTHDDDITVNKTDTKAVNTELAGMTLFLDPDRPFLFHVTYRDYKVTRTMCCNLQYDEILTTVDFYEFFSPFSPVFRNFENTTKFAKITP